MFKKIVTVLFVISLLPVFLYAQEKTVLKPKGMSYYHNGNWSGNEVIPIDKWTKARMDKNKLHKNKNIVRNNSNSDNTLSLIDTLYIDPDPESRFGFYGQDRMLQWFVAPADLFLKEVGFWFAAGTTQPVATLEIKIVGFQPGITADDLGYVNNELVGSYEALGTYNGITAFLDDPERTGPWTGFNGHPEVFGNDIWSDLGVGKSYTPLMIDTVSNPPVPAYEFVDLSDLGYPDIPAGTIFGVVIKNLHTVLQQQVIRLWANSPGTGGTFEHALWKFYADDNTNQPPTDDWGWWTRDTQLSMAAIVEIYGNTPPDINSFTTIPGGTDLGPFTIDANITDENPGDPTNAGVASAMIQWSTDEGTTWNDVAMTDMGSDMWSGDIPVQPGNIKITYRISATDVTSLTSVSNPVSFYTFEPTGANTLVIFNGFEDTSGDPQDFYFGPGVEFERDTWVSGGIPDEALLNNYTNIFEIWNEANGTYNDSLIYLWIQGDPGRNYFLSGQEWLGAKNAYNDSDYVAGSFEYDILGVSHSYNDISYDGTVGQNIPSLLIPTAGTAFGDPLINLFNSVPNNPDSLMYNPTFATGNPNWMDAFDVVSGTVIDMQVETRGIGGVGNVQTLPTMAHRTLTAGNKVIFSAYDPIALTTAVDDTYPYFYWVGADTANNVFQALRWFEIPVGVENEGNLPIEFSLEQNYPNPFNPATTIKFSIPEQSRVTLKIYDVLGREVRTLVNEVRNAGSHDVNFDASGLASGMYIYSIKAGDYNASKKMMLLK